MRTPRALLCLLALSLVACQEGAGSGGSPGGTAGETTSAGSPVEGGAEEGRSVLHEHAAPPPTRGMDGALLEEAVEEAAALPRLHNMIVARHGDVVLERHFGGPPPHRPANVKSVSKSLLSAVVGLAIEVGHLEGIHQTIGPFFPDRLPVDGEAGQPHEASRREDPRLAITLEDLLTMRSGLESTSHGSRYGRWVASSDWVGHALGRPLRDEPGSRMVYSTGDTHLASAVLTRAAGRSTHAVARELLAEPLGISLPPWVRDPQGIYFGGNDMLISPRDLLRFGELYRMGGIHDGRRVLPRGWVEESWRVRVRSPRNGNGYGLGWWARESGGHSVRFAWGYGGQFLFVVPALELTVVFTSDPYGPRRGGHNRALHRILDEHLVPAAETGDGRPAWTRRMGEEAR